MPGTARERMSIRKQETPAVVVGFGGEVVHLGTTSSVEGEMVRARTIPLVRSAAQRR